MNYRPINNRPNNNRPSQKMTVVLAALLVLMLLSACQPLPAPAAMETEAAGGSAIEAAAASNAVEFTAIDTACADGNIVQSDSPFLAGSSQIAVIQEPDQLHFDMDVTLAPDAFPDSTWVVPGYGFEKPDGDFIVYHSGDGAGELEGSRIYIIATPLLEAVDLPCEPVGPVARLQGVIISDLIEEETGVIATEFRDMDISCPDGNIVISEEPMMAGSSDVEVVPADDGIHMTVNVAQFPDAYPNASWIAPGEGISMPNDGFRVIHQGVGTGDFEGDSQFYIVFPAQDLTDLPCEPDGPVVVSEGVIIQRN